MVVGIIKKMKQVVAITIYEGDYIAKPEVGRHRIMCTDNSAAQSASAPRFSSFCLAGGKTQHFRASTMGAIDPSHYLEIVEHTIGDLHWGITVYTRGFQALYRILY